MQLLKITGDEQVSVNCGALINRLDGVKTQMLCIRTVPAMTAVFVLVVMDCCFHCNAVRTLDDSRSL